MRFLLRKPTVYPWDESLFCTFHEERKTHFKIKKTAFWLFVMDLRIVSVFLFLSSASIYDSHNYIPVTPNLDI